MLILCVAIPDHPIQNLRLRISGGTAQRSGRTPLAPVIFQAGSFNTNCDKLFSRQHLLLNNLLHSYTHFSYNSHPFLFSFCFFSGKVGDVCKVTPAWGFQRWTPSCRRIFNSSQGLWPDMARYDQIVGCDMGLSENVGLIFPMIASHLL